MGLQYIIGNIQSATNQCVQTQTFKSLEPRTPLERKPRHFSEIKDFQVFLLKTLLSYGNNQIYCEFFHAKKTHHLENKHTIDVKVCKVKKSQTNKV